MKDIKQFIEKAIEGGWKGHDNAISAGLKEVDICVVLLSPEVWKAVGKVEGWHDKGCIVHGKNWQEQMIDMMTAITEGKTIEEFIKTL